MLKANIPTITLSATTNLANCPLDIPSRLKIPNSFFRLRKNAELANSKKTKVKTAIIIAEAFMAILTLEAI